MVGRSGRYLSTTSKPRACRVCVCVCEPRACARPPGEGGEGERARDSLPPSPPPPPGRVAKVWEEVSATRRRIPHGREDLSRGAVPRVPPVPRETPQAACTRCTPPQDEGGEGAAGGGAAGRAGGRAGRPGGGGPLSSPPPLPFPPSLPLSLPLLPLLSLHCLKLSRSLGRCRQMCPPQGVLRGVFFLVCWAGRPLCVW